MPAEDALQSLARIVAQKPNLNILLASQPDNGVVLQRLNLTDDLAESFLRIALNAITAMTNETVLRPYEAGYKPERHERFYLDLKDHAEIAGQIEQFAAIGQAELFSKTEEIIDNLKCYAIVLSIPGDRYAVCFREYSRKKELGRAGILAAMFRQGAYDKIEDKVFLFDRKVDCFACGGYLFINNISAFQRIFAYFKAIMARADETLDTILNQIPVNNADQFRMACKSQTMMMSKLFQISKKPYLVAVTMEQIRRTIDDFGLDVQVVVVEGKEQLVFEASVAKRWMILKLLDDGYLGSTMTNLKYDVNSKSPLAG